MERIEQVKQLLINNPNDSFLQHALALELIKRGEDKEAKNLFEALLERDPGYVGSYYHLAKLLERTGDTNNAVEWYKKGLNAAKQAGNKHAANELQSAYDDLLDE